jgi:GxxExxY protein
MVTKDTKSESALDISSEVIAAAIKVQQQLGPGLFESVYQTCLAYELRKMGFDVREQAPIAIKYGELTIDNAFRADFIIDNSFVIELKAVDKLTDIHFAQLLSYLRLAEKRFGLLLNFNSWPLKNGGIKRVINGYDKQ